MLGVWVAEKASSYVLGVAAGHHVGQTDTNRGCRGMGTVLGVAAGGQIDTNLGCRGMGTVLGVAASHYVGQTDTNLGCRGMGTVLGRWQVLDVGKECRRGIYHERTRIAFGAVVAKASVSRPYNPAHVLSGGKAFVMVMVWGFFRGHVECARAIESESKIVMSRCRMSS